MQLKFNVARARSWTCNFCGDTHFRLNSDWTLITDVYQIIMYEIILNSRRTSFHRLFYISHHRIASISISHNTGTIFEFESESSSFESGSSNFESESLSFELEKLEQNRNSN